MHRRRRVLVSEVSIYPGFQAADERVFRLLKTELSGLSGLQDNCLSCEPQYTIHRTHHQDLRLEQTHFGSKDLPAKLFILPNHLHKLRV